MRQVEDRTWSNDGRETVRLVDREIMPARVLEDLQEGTIWLPVPPVKRKHARVECVRVALPTTAAVTPARSSPESGMERERETPDEKTVEAAGRTETGEASGVSLSAERAAALERVLLYVQPRGPDECWPLVWPEGIKGTDADGYPRIKVAGKYVRTYQLVYEAKHGEQGPGESVDHVCHNLAHLEGVSAEENRRRRWEWARRRERVRANGTEVKA
jgi:hypothetical protein